MTVNHLVTLVGSNPLSSFAALATLRPTEATFVHTAQSADSANRLAELSTRLFDRSDAIGFLEVDPTDFLSTRHAIEDLDIEPWHLDYTGGTKSMASAARLAFEVAGVRRPESPTAADPDGAHYVDDSVGVVRSDGCAAVPIDERPYDLDAIASLHGCQIVRPTLPNRRTSGSAGTPFEERMAAIVEAWNDDCDRRSGGSGRVAHETILNLEIDLGDTRSSELDVTVQRGRRVGIVSCYSGSGMGAAGRVKLKLFEAMVRASQLAGDLARVAVAAPISEHQVRLVYSDLGPRWGPRRVLILGERGLEDMERGAYERWEQWWGLPPGMGQNEKGVPSDVQGGGDA